ncbi:MAG: hydroxymethylglutaryl-CoA lyase [Bacteroidia bacterium]
MMFITECPRDAMQGIHQFIPTETKIDYLKSLIDAGFPMIDAGSFVSPKAIPQMADSNEVFDAIGEIKNETKLLAIVANPRGAADAVAHDNISFLGYPFSVSETFQKRNTNAGIEESLIRVEEIQNIAIKSGKTLLVYLSMAFGNPYGDPWSPELVTGWASRIGGMGISHLALADTTGMSDTQSIHSLFSVIIPALAQINISAHLHARPHEVQEKTEAAWQAGCRRFDTALKGFGGCPMAGDELTGNMATEEVLDWCHKNQIETGVSSSKLAVSMDKSSKIFNTFH